MKRLILASQSPRRKELLEKYGYHFDIFVSNDEEVFDDHLTPEQNAIAIARRKALKVAREANGIILAADTLVVLNQKMFGKPKDRIDAEKMLKSLSGQTHQVITAFTLYDTESKKELSDSVITTVTFNPLTDADIQRYLDSEAPYDKAGAYAIQERGDRFIRKIEGSYTNVIGLPMDEVCEALGKMGVSSECSSEN